MRQVSLAVLLVIFTAGSFKPQAETYDICVYGGTSAGVIAAYTAVKYGKKVLLIEPGNTIGGLSSGGLGYTDIGNKYAITGLALDFYRRLGKHYGKFEQWIFEPHVAEEVFNDYVKEAGINVLYGYRIRNADKQNGKIRSIQLENSESEKNVLKTIKAKIFIDCSYEGDLMAKSGITYTIGRESNSTYNETWNGIQLMNTHQFPDGVDPYKIPGDSSSGLLWGISNSTLQSIGSGDRKVQSYNYRICLTDDPDNRLPIERPDGYDSGRYELLVRLFHAQPDKKALNDYFFFGSMPNRKTDINNRGGFSTDMIGMNYQYPDADYPARTLIIKQHEDYVKGLLYFCSTDPRVPEPLRKELLQWGYPKDEYVNNDHWSPQLYVRESRRMIGAYIMTQANCQGKEIVKDGVGLAAYTMDSHNCQRIVYHGMVKNEGDVQIGGFGPYPVSYRSLIPKESECRNLLVPVCLSASHIAYGSIRMEPVFMVLAQSSAIAACLAITNNVSVQQVDVSQIRAVLKNNPLMDGMTPEVIVDNEDRSKVFTKGKWIRETAQGFGPSYFVTDPSFKGEAMVRFTPALSTPGLYTVYTHYVNLPQAATQVSYEVSDGKNVSTVIIRKKDVIVDGQTSGEWIKLGAFQLPKGNIATVTVKGDYSDGVVVADALLFVPVK
ncbi:MAG TPA: FAD-dependent oxidoreductase [Flavitalea sp.]|nr:FAD-dependent oxidoreductase [Flavitalea sp.]